MRGTSYLTSPVDIRPDQLEIVQDILLKHLPAGVKVWVFGSRANWTTKDSSDLDLALEGESKLSYKVLGALKDAFEDSSLPYMVDVVDLNRIGDSFRKIVESQRAPLSMDGDGTTPGEWIQCTVAEACSSINYGLTASASSRSDGPQFLRITDIVSGQIDWSSVPHVEADDDTLAKYQLHDGDIVIARTGASTGTSAYVSDPPPSVFASYLVRLQARPGVDARFLAYYLKSREFWDFIRGVLGDKSAQPNASASTMTAAPFRAPRDEVKQRDIAHVLGALDDRIELNRRMNQTLESMARALFKSWFLDFGPVRAKMEGLWHRGESLPGLPADLYDLFPGRLVDSELGEIPEGWEIVPLSECIDVVRGLSYKGSGLADHGMPMHNLNSIFEGGGYKNEGIKYYDGEYKSRHVIRPGDVIVANTEQGHDRLLIGYAAIVPALYGDSGLFSHHLYRVRPRKSRCLTTDFICQLLNSQSMQGAISGYATGTTVNMLPLDALSIMAIVAPPPQIVTAFDNLAGAVRKRCEGLIEESLSLTALRDALLPRLVSGDMVVGGVTQLKDAPS